MFAQSLKRGATKTRIPLRARQFTSHAPQPDGLVLPYHTSVAFKPKNRDDNRLMRKHLKTTQVESPSGEDNYFVTTHGQQLACGVADGVGGWAELGYDSSAISRELCSAMSEAFDKNTEVRSPKALLDFAFDKIQKDGTVKVGGTTACLGIFDSHTLRVANLGDSWCGVFRDYRLIAETKVQTHGFNTPYQLAIIPQEIKDQNKGSRFIMDRPLDADEYEFEVAKDDIVIFATDGVIDNIDIKDIEIYLRDNEGVPLEKLNHDFVQNVYKLSKDEDFPSVFSQELSKLTGQFYSGGKEDDITVVMVKVQ